MSKKHYIRLAEVIRLAKPYAEGSDQAERIVRDIAGTIANVCEDDNPRFDRARFLAACGFPE